MTCTTEGKGLARMGQCAWKVILALKQLEKVLEKYNNRFALVTSHLVKFRGDNYGTATSDKEVFSHD